MLAFLWLGGPASQPANAIEPLQTIRLNTIHIHGLCFSPDGKRLAAVGQGSGPDNKWIRVWDVENFKVVHEKKGDYWSLAYRHDGAMLIAGGRQGLTFWQPERGHARAVKNDLTIMALSASPVAVNIAWGGERGVIHLFSAPGIPLRRLDGHRANVASLAHSPDGKRLASVGRDGGVMVWDSRSGRLIARFFGHEKRCTSVSFSPDGKRVASGSVDRTVRVWDVASKTSVATLKDHADQVQAVAYSPDGKYLASGAFDSVIRIWDAENWRLITTLPHHRRSVDRLAFSPDGKLLVSGGQDGAIRVWEMTAVLKSIKQPPKVAFAVKAVPADRRDQSSPSSVWMTLRAAIKSGDWKLELACFTPASRVHVLGGVVLQHSQLAFALRNTDPSKITEEELFGRYMEWTNDLDACLRKHGIDPDSVSAFALAAEGEDAVKRTLERISQAVKQPELCYAELNALFAKTFPEEAVKVRAGKIGPAAALEKVAIDGDYAHAVLVQEAQGKRVETPVRFQRIKGKWHVKAVPNE